MVGIGGGVPSRNADIRLGDIVVSQPSDTFGGVVQCDFGKELSGGQFKRTGILNRPPKVLLTALATLQAHHFTEDSRVDEFVSKIQSKIAPHKARKFVRPSQEDCLFQAEYDHVASDTCINCDRSKLFPRPPRERQEPIIHYGLIGSSNQVVKCGERRDRLARDLGVLCMEMEAAGLMNDFPCLVIRGICDYADSHKNKEWQGYAAAVAAPYAKELLLLIPVRQIHSTPTARNTLADSDLTTAQVMQGQVGTLEPGPTETGDLCQTGRSLYLQKRYKEADTIFRRALQGQERELGPNHTDTLISMYWLGRSLYQQDQYKEAEAIFRRCLRGREKVLGHDHEDTLYSRKWMDKAHIRALRLK